jgi:hypothetical protein
VARTQTPVVWRRDRFDPRALPTWARGADILTLALLIVAAYVAVHGGFVLHPAGLRLSVRSGLRVLGWAAGIFVVRHAFLPQPAAHTWMPAALATAARRQGPLFDDLEFAGRRRPAAIPQSRRRSVLITAVVVVVFALLTAGMTWPQIRRLDSVSPDTADPLLSTWRLAWIAHQLPRDPLHLYDTNIFYPERATLAYSDAMLVPALMGAPLIWSGVHQLYASNLLLLSGFALSGVTMFLLMRHLTGRTDAALVAGFIFAFLPYRFMHYAHLELQMAQWMPLSLLWLHRTVASGRLRDGLLAGTFLALQTLSSWYYGIFFSTWVIPVAAALLIGAGAPAAWRAARPLAAGLLVAVLLVLPFSLPYFSARRAVGERPLDEIEFYSATPRNYLAAHSRNALLGKRTTGMGGQERELFSGIAVPALAIVGMWPPLSAARVGYAVTLAVAFELSLGFHGLVYPWLHEYVLPYRGLRVPARMGMLVGLSLAILAGFGVARLCARVRRPAAAAALCIGIGALVFVEYRSRLLLEYIWLRPPPVYDAISAEPNAVVLELPMIAPDVALEPAYMYFSTFDWHRLVNGYSGFSPPSYQALLRLMATFPNDEGMSELRRRHVSFIVVHGAFYKPMEYDDVVRRLDERRDVQLIRTSRWQRRDSRVYRLLP